MSFCVVWMALSRHHGWATSLKVRNMHGASPTVNLGISWLAKEIGGANPHFPIEDL
jgi:hypothetical protein